MKTPEEVEKELKELAELLMQSENIDSSVEILRGFAQQCWIEGAIYAQNDAVREIRENYTSNDRL